MGTGDIDRIREQLRRVRGQTCPPTLRGPFTNIQQVKEWEESNGNNTYLYLIRGKKKYAKKYMHIIADKHTSNPQESVLATSSII